jgi:hypothetical protein
LDLLAPPAPSSGRDVKKKSSHHWLGRRGRGRAEPLRIAPARERELTGILVMTTAPIVLIKPLVPIIIEERLFRRTSTIENGMADQLVHVVGRCRNSTTAYGKCESKGRKSDDRAHRLASGCCDVRSFLIDRHRMQPLADGDLMPVVSRL